MSLDAASARELCELANRYALSPRAAARLAALLAILAGDPHAPTTIDTPLAAIRDHLADSLDALKLPEVRAATRVADIGAGPGLPGLPLAIALPEARVMLVESNARKAAFIEGVIARCDIANAEAVHARVEEWDTGLGDCDLVTARALAPLGVIAEYAAPLLTDGGTLVAWRGRRDPDDEAIAARAAGELGLEVRSPVAVIPYPGALHRHLHVLVKVAPTPPRFPRRPGMARKRPLGADVRGPTGPL